MKKLFIVSLLYCFIVLLLTIPVLAVKPTPTDEATPPGKIIKEERQEQIKELRERVATKVAELREKMRRAWHGEIKSISGTTIILTTGQGEKTIQTSEETSFFRIGTAGRKKITLADLVVGEKIVAFGQVSSETGEMTGRIIIARVFPVKINGKVTAVDTEGGTITVQTFRHGTFIVDVETTTKILVWEKEEGFKKYGLSKIKVGDRVHVNGYLPTKPKEGENRITANRILVLPGRAVGITGEKPATPAASPKTSPTATPAAE
jgi:hypothetical protein